MTLFIGRDFFSRCYNERKKQVPLGGNMNKELFLRKKYNEEKLISFGFQKEKKGFRYTTKVLNGEFELSVFIIKNKLPDTVLTEIETGEEYVLHKTNASGVFVGKVREVIAEVLQKIAAHCYEDSIFKYPQTLQIIESVRKVYGDEMEYLWEKFPDNAIVRRKDNQKWYAVILTVSRRKLKLDSDEMVEIVDLRGDPEKLPNLVDGKLYFPGWHMNKKHWYTIILDGSVPLEEICHRIDESYALAK